MDEQAASEGEIRGINSDLSRSRWRISLSPEFEAQFQERTRRQRTSAHSRWHAGGILINAACLPLDFLAGIGEMGLIARLGLVTPLYAAGIWILLRGPVWLHGPAIVLPIVAFISTVFFLGFQVPSPFGERYLMAAAMLLVGANITTPMSFRQALAVAGLSVAALFILQFTTGAPTPGSLTLSGFIAGIAPISLIVRFQSEREARDAFLLRRQDEIKSAHLVALTTALAEIAETDALTGLPNRRGLTRVLSEKWRAASETNDWIGILMIDIDHFKKFNDAAGHEEGDRCLKAVADALKAQAVRDGHYVARFGGEEFTAILTGLEPEPALETAENLRRAVEHLCLPHPAFAQGRSVTVTIGASVLLPAPQVTVREVMAAADRALYHAKEAGRNRVGFGQVDLNPAGRGEPRRGIAAAG